MDLRLDGKVALVTGSSKGIGKGIAEELARSGADVTITYEEDKSGAEETAAVVREQGRRALIVQVDVADEAQVDRLYRAHLAEFGRLDILVNNAAIVSHGRIHEMSTETWRKVMSANLDGAFFCMRAAARQMIAQGGNGRIIAISSVHEEACTDGGGPYAGRATGCRTASAALAVSLHVSTWLPFTGAAQRDTAAFSVSSVTSRSAASQCRSARPSGRLSPSHIACARSRIFISSSSFI